MVPISMAVMKEYGRKVFLSRLELKTVMQDGLKDGWMMTGVSAKHRTD